MALKADGWAADVPLRPHVWNFTLPVLNHLATAFGFSPHEVCRFHDRPRPGLRPPRRDRLGDREAGSVIRFMSARNTCNVVLGGKLIFSFAKNRCLTPSAYGLAPLG